MDDKGRDVDAHGSESSNGSAATANKGTLVSLDLSCNTLGDLDFTAVLPPHSNLGLAELSLACTSFGGVRCALTFTSKTSKSSGRLGIGDSFVPRLRGLRALCDAIPKSRCLTRLDLSGNGLAAGAVVCLADLLAAVNCPLERLNVAYNAFDPSEKELRDLLVKRGQGGEGAGDGGAAGNNNIDGAGIDTGSVSPMYLDHPLVTLLSQGVLPNTRLRELDLTGCCRFGILDPTRSCDPDDRQLDGKVRMRSRLDARRATVLGDQILAEVQDALSRNTGLQKVWLGQVELEAPALAAIERAMNQRAGGSSSLSSSASAWGASMPSSSSSSLSSSKRRRVFGAHEADSRRAVAHW